MARICYRPKKFNADHRAIIDKANEIIESYQEQGFDLTLRQLYYQFISQDIFPNNEKSYDRLGSIINDARLAGEVDWNAIKDRTRGVEEKSKWDNPGEIVGTCVRAYGIDMWVGQTYRPWCFIEKDALSGIFDATCKQYDVPLLSCRGYLSQSEAWNTGRRLKDQIADDYMPIIFHFGDHDPSGLDMTEDLRNRMAMFAETDVELRRIALNRDQIEQYRPPPNPAKMSDGRAKKYVARHGNSSWELDALSPSVLVALLTDEVVKLIDYTEWNKRVKLEKEHKNTLQHLSENWENV